MGQVETPLFQFNYFTVFQPTPNDLYVALFGNKLNNCETTGSVSKAVRQLKICHNKELPTTEKLTEYTKYYQNSLTVHVQCAANCILTVQPGKV